MAKNLNPDQLIEICFGSPEGYAALSSKILSGLGQSNDSYQQTLLEKLSNIIISKSNTPTQRFYALYFLLKATDHAPKLFFEKIAKAEDLLAFLFRSAQYQYFKKTIHERGTNFFSAKPSSLEAKAGSNFVRLCIETLIHWQAVWGDKNSSNPCHIFNFYISTLKKKITLPAYYHFIGRNFVLNKNITIWNFADRLPLTKDSSSSKSKKKHEKLDKENKEPIQTRENKEAKKSKETKEIVSDDPDADDENLDDINEENPQLDLHDEEEDLFFTKIRSNKRAHTTVATNLGSTFQRALGDNAEKDRGKNIEFHQEYDGAIPKDDGASTSKEAMNRLIFEKDDIDLGELGFKKVISAPDRTPPSREKILTQKEAPKNSNTNKQSQSSSSSAYTSDTMDKFKKAVNTAKNVVHTLEPVKGKVATNKIALELLEIQNSIQKSKDRKLQGAFPSSGPELQKETQIARKHTTLAQIDNQAQTNGSIWNDQLARPLTPLEILNNKNDLSIPKSCVRAISQQEATSLGKIDEAIKPGTGKSDRFNNMVQGIFNQTRTVSNPGPSPTNNLYEQRDFHKKPSGLVKKDPFLKWSADEMQNNNPQLQRGQSHIYEYMPIREVGKDPIGVVKQVTHGDFADNNALPKNMISLISSTESVWIDDGEEARGP